MTGEPIDPTAIPAAGPDEGCDDPLTQPVPPNLPKVKEDMCKGLRWLDRIVIWLATGCRPMYLKGPGDRVVGGFGDGGLYWIFLNRTHLPFVIDRKVISFVDTFDKSSIALLIIGYYGLLYNFFLFSCPFHGQPRPPFNPTAPQSLELQMQYLAIPFNLLLSTSEQMVQAHFCTAVPPFLNSCTSPKSTLLSV